MKKNEIEELAQNGNWQGKPLKGKLVETHISWVILSEEFVFKIKRPETFSFLDFSSLEARKYYSEREVTLNSRFTDIYLDVVEIHQSNGSFTLGGKDSQPVEYAVRMKKIDPAKEMQQMLRQGRVTTGHTRKLATALAAFHAKAEIIKTPFDIKKMKEDFNDLRSVQDNIEDSLGKSYGKTIEDVITYSDRYLEESQGFLKGRSTNGFRRDLHGDFHSGNIFLTEEPTIFDCIEFNDKMRQIDILDEIAFFCMDMEAHEKPELARQFLKYYQKEMSLNFSAKEMELLNYYKLYRANVRAKVSALKEDFKAAKVEPYLHLMEKYASAVK